jgi:hypothetical protein
LICDVFALLYRSKGEWDSNAMISIFTNNWTNQAATMAVAKSIFNIGVHGRLRYKPEIFTALGIYYENPYNLKTTVYEVEQY